MLLPLMLNNLLSIRKHNAPMVEIERKAEGIVRRLAEIQELPRRLSLLRPGDDESVPIEIIPEAVEVQELAPIVDLFSIPRSQVTIESVAASPEVDYSPIIEAIRAGIEGAVSAQEALILELAELKKARNNRMAMLVIMASV